MATQQSSALETICISSASAIRISFRDRTVMLLAVMFIIMVLISAYLGWSATNTVNHIYDAAVPAMKAQGLAPAANPVGEMPPLSLFRNMVTYVALLGGLAALVLGHQVIAVDRKSGVLPLLLSRPVSRVNLALGKIVAIATTIAGLLATAAVINLLTMLLLPNLAVDGAVVIGLAKFYGVSLLYMLAFSLLGAACAVVCKTESMALLVPVTIWLALTFIVPQVTSNIGPMAALNPLSANLVQPDGLFFSITSTLLGPLSIAEAYRYLASTVLEVLSGAGTTITLSGALTSLIIANIAMASAVVLAIHRLDASRSDYND
jgi:ABC-type transport system involved in multi-copper enzyme maturation permease subunit